MNLEVCSDFKIGPHKYKNQNYTQNGVTEVTSKNMFFNRNSFGKSKTETGFVASKQLRQ